MTDAFGGNGWSTTLTQQEPLRATLALTTEGPVLGCPADATDKAREEAWRAVEKWRQESQHQMQTLVLPWPVDVMDIRR